jgi:hypothetical protein
MSDSPQPRRLVRRQLMVALGAGASGVGLGWWLQRPAPQAQESDADSLAPLWAMRLDRPEGGELVLADWRGKPLLINFWATWCAPCVREMPEIDRFHREFGPRGWQVLGLAIDSPTPVREFLGRVKVGFAIGLAGLDGTELVRKLGNPQGGLPFSVMIDAKGKVMQRKLGETDFKQLADWASKS